MSDDRCIHLDRIHNVIDRQAGKRTDKMVNYDCTVTHADA